MNNRFGAIGARMDRLGRRRLIALVALLTLLPLVALTFLSVRMAGDAVHRQLISRTRTTAHVSASLVDRQLEGLKELVHSYAERPTLIAALQEDATPRQRREAINFHVSQLKEAAPGIGTAFVTDAEGTLLSISPSTPSIVGDNFAYRDWFRGVTRLDDTYVSRVYTSAAAGNPRVVAAATPIRAAASTDRAEPIGFMVAAFTTETIQSFAEILQSAEGIQLTVADQDGNVLAGGDNPSRIAPTDPRLIAALRGESGVGEDSNHEGLSAFAPVPDIGWAVLAEAPENDAHGMIATLRSTVFGIAGVLALALLAGLILLALALRERDRVEAERKKTQEELVLARQRAVEASRLKSEFLANMSHEIRTPMNGVMGMAALLVETDLTNEQREYAETIYRSGDSLLTIINDILDFSKVEAGKLEIEIVDFEVRTVVEEVAELLCAAAHNKGLELINLIRPNVPEMVKGDPGRLRQILMNLIGNAIKFTESGEIITSVSVLGAADDRVAVRFEVADTGIGIAAEDKVRLFESFSQVDASTTRRYGGTGLGLAVSQQLVGLMGGRIGVESEPGHGSTFWFEVTFDWSDEEPTPLVIEHSVVKDLRVLVVDDNETNRIVFDQSLRGWGMRPTCVAGGHEAITLVRSASESGEPFQAALLDFHMPEMDGLELASALSSDPDLRDIKMLLLTSGVQKHDLEVASAAGIQAYLQKPVKQSALYDTIAAVVGNSSAGPRRQMVTGYKLAEAKAGTRRRILVAEDNLVNQKVAAAMLEKLGHRVDIAANGQEAVAAIEAIDYDLVLMDCQMPVMDGYEATMEIRRTQNGGLRIPIIAMTASARKEDEDKAMAAGMDGYISKPVKLADLAAIVDGTLAAERSTGDGPPLDPQIIATLKELDEDAGSFFPAFMKTFIAGTNERLGELRRAFSKDGWAQEALALAHALKGSCGSAGASVAAALCTDIEQALEAGDKSGAEELTEALAEELERVRAALATELGATASRNGADPVA